jgi:hypothetical protein
MDFPKEKSTRDQTPNPNPQENGDQDWVLNLPKEIKEFSKEMRKLRLNQPWVSKEEAYRQCRRVELRASEM